MENIEDKYSGQSKHLQLLQFGEPDTAVALTGSAESELKADEVLIAMEAAPIYLSDFLLVRRIYGVKPAFPAPLGAEGVGKVIAIGKTANPDLIGQLVIIPRIYSYGTWAEQVAVPQQFVIPINAATDPLQQAQMSINALTAYLLLKNYTRLMPGNWIGQTAANSAVGQYVIALAKLMGLKTLNVVRSQESAALVKSLGGDAVVLSGENLEAQIKDAIKGEQLNLVLDTVGQVATLKKKWPFAASDFSSLVEINSLSSIFKWPKLCKTLKIVSILYISIRLHYIGYEFDSQALRILKSMFAARRLKPATNHCL